MSQQTATTSTAIRAVNGVDLDVLEGTIGAITGNPSLGQCHFRVSNAWHGGSRNSSTVSSFYGAGQENQHKQPYVLHSDEPPVLAGSDDAPNPVEHLLNALAACLTTGIVAHAAVRGIHIRSLSSEVEGDLDLRGFLGIDSGVPRGFTDIRIRFEVDADTGDLEQLRRLSEFSPVFRTLTEGTRVHIDMAAAS
jgi:uncharacterized OsmC-like protein